MRRLAGRTGRGVMTVLVAFVLLLLVSSATSWWIWDQYYDGLFKERIFTAVLLGNVITSAVGSLMVALARGSR